MFAFLFLLRFFCVSWLMQFRDFKPNFFTYDLLLNKVGQISSIRALATQLICPWREKVIWQHTFGLARKSLAGKFPPLLYSFVSRIIAGKRKSNVLIFKKFYYVNSLFKKIKILMYFKSPQISAVHRIYLKKYIFKAEGFVC